MRSRLLKASLLSGLFVFGACGGVNEPKFKSSKLGMGSTLEELQNRLKTAKEDKDPISANETQLEINYQTELERAGMDAEEQGRVHRKYKILKEVFQDELRDYRENPSSFMKGFGMETDTEYYDGPVFSSVYHPLVLQEVERVYKDYGRLYVNVTLDDQGRPAFKSVAVRKENEPWAGDWYPFHRKSLYTGPEAPLKKFEDLLKKKGKQTHLIKRETDRFDRSRYDHWEGMCFQHSLAAAVSPEPKKELIIEGIRFSIADQKALLTFTHLGYPHVMYGVDYRGDSKTDGTFQDLKPEAVHQLILSVVGKEGRSLIADDDPGPTVWFKNIKSYRYKIEQDPQKDYVLNLKAYVHLVKERSKETDDPTNDDDIIVPVYTARFYVDKKDKKDGQYAVLGGQWVGSSFRDHIDMIGVPSLKGELKSHNESFNKYMKLYKSLFMNPSSQVR